MAKKSKKEKTAVVFGEGAAPASDTPAAAAAAPAKKERKPRAKKADKSSDFERGYALGVKHTRELAEAGK